MARRAGLLRNRLNERILLSWAQTNESLRATDSSSPVIAVMQPAHALLANHCCGSSKLRGFRLRDPDRGNVLLLYKIVIGRDVAGNNLLPLR